MAVGFVALQLLPLSSWCLKPTSADKAVGRGGMVADPAARQLYAAMLGCVICLVLQIRQMTISLAVSFQHVAVMQAEKHF